MGFVEGSAPTKRERVNVTYTKENFKTKKALKEAVKNGETVKCFQPGMGTVPTNGTVYLEGPHYPQPHSWYAQATMKDGRVVSVK